ncbi:hypothetical protein WAF17_12705 [Bernardetia sp. ABR2-2B]|uniref:hypothetical protein n=1 Tax=Bernardetia sp. ABR2-2B TaxID=3127472 RepID=UPI0030D50BC3
MQLLSFNSIVFLTLLTFSFSSCGNKSTIENTQDTSTENSVSNTEEEVVSLSSSSSKVLEFEKQPCDLLTEELLKSHIAINTTIEKQFVEYEDGKYPRAARCVYSWKKPNAKEKEDEAISQMLDAARSGGNKKMNIKEMSTDYNVAISIEPFKGKSENFVPKNTDITDEEIEKRAKQAGEMALERMKPEQIEALGGKEKAASISGESTRKMLTKLRDELVVVEGVGDAAYWNPLGFDNTLMILSGDKMVSIEVYISDERQENIDVAKKIAEEIL